MKLNGASTLRQVVALVGGVLNEGGVKAVVTGGACASLHSRGVYQSADVDLIILNDTTRGRLDELMALAGFHREGDRYVHPTARFFVEFPRGPLAIGADLEVRPIEISSRGRTFLALSPTDSCRDRLAAFYHWRDRQSLRIAVWIALANELDMRSIGAWSRREGFARDYSVFLREVERSRQRRGRRSSRPGH